MDITHVEVIEGHTVRLRFEDGTEKTVDLDPYLYGPVFDEIRRDPAVFAAVRVDTDAGTIVWPNGADLAPDTLYEGRRSARMDVEARPVDQRRGVSPRVRPAHHGPPGVGESPGRPRSGGPGGPTRRGGQRHSAPVRASGGRTGRG